jgi:hypothetical protein
MRPVRFHGFHFPKGPNLQFVAVSAAWMFSFSLALFSVLTYMAGTEFSESMGGAAGLIFLVIGFLASVVIAYLERDAA